MKEIISFNHGRGILALVLMAGNLAGRKLFSAGFSAGLWRGFSRPDGAPGSEVPNRRLRCQLGLGDRYASWGTSI